MIMPIVFRSAPWKLTARKKRPRRRTTFSATGVRHHCRNRRFCSGQVGGNAMAEESTRCRRQLQREAYTDEAEPPRHIRWLFSFDHRGTTWADPLRAWLIADDDSTTISASNQLITQTDGHSVVAFFHQPVVRWLQCQREEQEKSTNKTKKQPNQVKNRQNPTPQHRSIFLPCSICSELSSYRLLPTSSSPPVSSPTSPAAPLRSVFCRLLKLCALVSALAPSPLPIALSAPS